MVVGWLWVCGIHQIKEATERDLPRPDQDIPPLATQRITIKTAGNLGAAVHHV